MKWARECLRRVKLYSRAEHYPSELSGGEKQRAAIARALVNRPSIVLCDEPTGNLDEDTADTVVQLISELNREEGQAFLIVTHDVGIHIRDMKSILSAILTQLLHDLLNWLSMQEMICL